MKINLPTLSIAGILFLARVNASFAQTYNMAAGTITTCSGTFYDNGGAADYTNNCNLTETFTSSSGNCLTFTFTSFHTQAGNDILTIYDGPTTSSPVIGNFSGFVSPGTIISSTSSITFTFVSNLSTTRPGWAATISCASCGTNFLMNSNTSVNACDGLFYDSGGPAGNYSNNENYTQTYCSGNGNCIQFEFYSMSLSANDTLKIYDGPDAFSPLIASYTSTIVPPPLLSSTGCLTFVMRTSVSGTNAGWMAAISCTPCPSVPSVNATYLMPYIQLGGSYVGGAQVTSCSGTFTDDGGLSGNYLNNIFAVYQTFCPATLNTCLRVQFYDVHLKSGDILTIENGPTMGSPQFNSGSTLTNGVCMGYSACMAKGWGPYVSNDQSGCITFIWETNSSPNDSGWSATFDCVPCAGGPNGTDNNDCSRATPLCTSTSFADASTGPGIVSDVDDNCLITETYTNWYTFSVTSSGTLGMTIDPLSTGFSQPDDYDWALYGPNVSCTNLGNPIRCSSATTQGQSNMVGNMGNTGISTTQNQTWPGYSCASNNDLTEAACGNCWVNNLPVTAGQTYYLCISKWSAGGSGFNLNWNLTNGASIDCPVLPVELTSLTCSQQLNFISINWTSASEYDNDYYILEKSSDGENFEMLVTVPGKTFSSMPTQYLAVDNYPFAGNNYYRLKQVDQDGNETILQLTSCTFSDVNEEVVLQVFDLAGRLISSTNTTITGFDSFIHTLSLHNGVYVTAIIHENGMTELGRFLKVN
ncbi:MAG TPA: CUB domain-containing protein [Chitinophagales bacterium]|nr:CUB domain-containing protein [Chitinophagales bacterium]